MIRATCINRSVEHQCDLFADFQVCTQMAASVDVDELDTARKLLHDFLTLDKNLTTVIGDGHLADRNLLRKVFYRLLRVRNGHASSKVVQTNDGELTYMQHSSCF